MKSKKRSRGPSNAASASKAFDPSGRVDMQIARAISDVEIAIGMAFKLFRTRVTNILEGRTSADAVPDGLSVMASVTALDPTDINPFAVLSKEDLSPPRVNGKRKPRSRLLDVEGLEEDAAQTPGVAVGVRSQDPMFMSPERNTTLSPAAQHVLETFVRWGRHASATTLSILTNYSRTSSGFTGALSELKSKGLIEGSSAMFALTALGKSSPAGPPLPTRTDLVELTAKRFDPCAAEILRFLYNKYPAEPFTVRALAENTHKSTGETYSATSSGFTGAISKLRKQGILADTRVQIRLSTEFVTAAGLG